MLTGCSSLIAPLVVLGRHGEAVLVRHRPAFFRILGRPRLTFPHGNLAHGVDGAAGDVKVSGIRGRGTRNSNAVSCAAAQSVDALTTVVVLL